MTHHHDNDFNEKHCDAAESDNYYVSVRGPHFATGRDLDDADYDDCDDYDNNDNDGNDDCDNFYDDFNEYVLGDVHLAKPCL